MTTSTLTDRAPEGRRTNRYLGHPIAYLATALVLLALYAFPFVVDAERLGPTKDPAFYTWRTEALITEEPVRLLEIEGAQGMFAAGYRVAGVVLGALLRHIPEVGQLSVITILMILTPVISSLLLAGFAYRFRPDPLMFHSVAFATGGLYLTPPFVGYLDNVLCLMFLAASLFFMGPSRSSWPARVIFAMCLLLAGLTHPTTLVIFCLVLGAMAAVRLAARRFDLRSVIADDGPMLLTAFAATLITAAVWMIGIWGKSVSLNEAALPPPYGSDFFVDRMMLWVKAMRPVLNGPLLLLGAAGLLAAGRRAAEDQLARVSIVWLVPLAGLFGFVGGLTYPYYRFFNTTLAWVLLVGVGAYFVIRFLLDLAARGGANRLALLGVAAVAFVLATNFAVGFDKSGWTKTANQWMDPQTRADLDALRAELAKEDPDTPVVFVIDDEPSAPFQIYGFSKLSGNTSRYGLPKGMIDQGYLYLGEVGKYFEGEPTTRGNETYDELSPALLEDTEAGIERAGRDPIVVVAGAFNKKGANVEILESGSGPPLQDVWVVADGEVLQDDDPSGTGGDTSVRIEGGMPDAGAGHLLRVGIGFLLLLLPGLLAFGALPGHTFAESLGLVPALAAALLAVSGVAVIAVARAPFSAGHAWATLIVAAVAGLALGGRNWALRRSP